MMMISKETSQCYIVYSKYTTLRFRIFQLLHSFFLHSSSTPPLLNSSTPQLLHSCTFTPSRSNKRVNPNPNHNSGSNDDDKDVNNDDNDALFIGYMHH